MMSTSLSGQRRHTAIRCCFSLKASVVNGREEVLIIHLTGDGTTIHDGVLERTVWSISLF